MILVQTFPKYNIEGTPPKKKNNKKLYSILMSMVSIWVYVYFYRQIFILLDHSPMNQQGDSRLSQINSIKKKTLI